jgi:hypothetical protein
VKNWYIDEVIEKYDFCMGFCMGVVLDFSMDQKKGSFSKESRTVFLIDFFLEAFSGTF